MEEKTYSLHMTAPAIKLMQRALNEKTGRELGCDGNLGKITQDALSQYQLKAGTVESDAFGACYGPKTQAVLEPYIQKRFLNAQSILEAAASLGVEVASVKAILAVETKEFGFLPSGFPTILFERHKFYKALSQARGASFALSVSARRPDICNSLAGGYLGGKAEIKRLNEASAIDNACALASASWGLGQLMGFNYKMCGYDSVVAFTDAMKTSEPLQLKAIVSFIIADKTLHSALRAKNWPGVAASYNGSNYAVGGYHLKLAAAYTQALKE
jgi:hypothetical protein